MPDHRCALICRPLAILSLWFVCVPLAAGQESQENLDFFEKRVRPLLVTHCYECHSAASEEPGGNLRLDTRDGLLKGGDSGPALVAGDEQTA